MKATVRELRELFFFNDKYCVTDNYVYENKAIRKNLYNMEDQNKEFNYSVGRNFIKIWELNSNEVA